MVPPSLSPHIHITNYQEIYSAGLTVNTLHSLLISLSWWELMSNHERAKNQKEKENKKREGTNAQCTKPSGGMADDDQGGSLLGGAKSDLGYGNSGETYDLPSALVGTTLSAGGARPIGGPMDDMMAGYGAYGDAPLTATMAIGEEDDIGVMPRILLLGLKRSGKSSILKVVFNKMSPHETRHLESTKTPEKCCLWLPPFHNNSTVCVIVLLIAIMTMMINSGCNKLVYQV